MTDLTDKYPLVGKILAEQDSLFSFLGGATPPQLTELNTRVAQVIEDNVDRTDAEKEALIVGSVIALAPPYLLDDTSRFATEYSPEVNTIVTEMTATVGRTVAPTNLAQLSTAIGVVMMQDLVKGLQDGSLPVPREVIADAFQKASDDEKLVMPNLNAPKLEALYNATKAEIATELGNAPSAPKQTPPKFKPNKGGDFDF